MASPLREHMLIKVIDKIIDQVKDNDDIEASLDKVIIHLFKKKVVIAIRQRS
jgi:hypothetical protein